MQRMFAASIWPNGHELASCSSGVGLSTADGCAPCQALEMAAVGVDACKRGWVAVVLREGNPMGVHFLPTIGDITDSVPDADVIAIDIPIGLPDAGRRQADLAAKAMLGQRQNSVFMTPVRAALAAPSHAAATVVAHRADWSGNQPTGIRSPFEDLRSGEMAGSGAMFRLRGASGGLVCRDVRSACQRAEEVMARHG